MSSEIYLKKLFSLTAFFIYCTVFFAHYPIINVFDIHIH